MKNKTFDFRSGEFLVNINIFHLFSHSLLWPKIKNDASSILFLKLRQSLTGFYNYTPSWKAWSRMNLCFNKETGCKEPGPDPN